MYFVHIVVFGLIAGFLIQFLMHGRAPGEWVVTMFLGVAGGVFGYFMGHVLVDDGIYVEYLGYAGCILILLFYRFKIWADVPVH